MIQELKKCPTKSILTTYPSGYARPDIVDKHALKPTMLCAKEFDNDGLLHLTSTEIVYSKNNHSPQRSLFCAAGFRFSQASVIQQVPHDPSLHFLFIGEEISMSLRLWTHGWNFYAPTSTVLFHLWTRQYRPDFRESQTQYKNKIRTNSISKVLSQQYRKDNYLGSKRSLSDYEAFTGIQFSKRYISNFAYLGLPGDKIP